MNLIEFRRVKNKNNLKTIYNLKEQTGYLFAGKSIAFLFQFIIPVVLVRIFSQEEYGLYQTILLALNTLSSIITWNLSTSLYYYYKQYQNKSILITNTLFIQLSLSIIFLILYYFFSNTIFIFFNINPNFAIIFITATSVVLILNLDIFENLLIVEGKSNYVVLYLVFSSILKFFLLVISAFIFRNITYTIFSLLVFFLIQYIVMITYLRKNYKIQLSNLHIQEVKKQLKYIFPLGSAKIVGEVGSKIDKLLFNHFFSKSDFAIYSVATFRIPFVSLLFPSVSNVIIPNIALHAKKHEYNDARILWHKMIKIFSLITIPFVIYSWFTAKELIVLFFTDTYIEAVGVYKFILLTFLVQIFARGTIITAFGRTKDILYIQIVSSLLGSILGYYLIKKYGMWGAAITTVTIFYLNGLLQVIDSKRILKSSFSLWLPWKYIFQIVFISAIPIPAILLCKFFFSNNFVIILTATFIYFTLLLFLLNVFRMIEIKAIYQFIKAKFYNSILR